MSILERVLRVMAHINMGATPGTAAGARRAPRPFFFIQDHFMPHLRSLGRVTLCVAAIAFGPWVTAAESSADAAAIRHTLMATFDKPEARLQVDPVVAVGPHAVAGWAQGERGGRALLHKHGKDWRIVLCAGDGLKDPKMLREAGIGTADAQTLSKALAAAEAALPASQRAKFSTFDGVVRMDASGQHPPSHAPTGGTQHKH